MITTLAFADYRSLRDLRLTVGKLTVITGGNGVGKSNVYRALKLLTDAANGQLGRAIANEGGMPSALFAGGNKIRGKHKSEGRRLSIGFADQTMAYELRLGLPPPPEESSEPPVNAFPFDPLVKSEVVRTVVSPKVNLVERRNAGAMIRDDDGRAVTFGETPLDHSESILAQVAEPHRYPVLAMLRERLRRWRFYHQIRTDADSPLRQPQVGTLTPVLAHDGHDLASALITIQTNGYSVGLEAAVAEAFDGAQVIVAGGDSDARYSLHLETKGMARPLDASELSDGTLRYLALLAMLHSPRPPELLVLNEPETSLHPRLLEPLGRQIADAAKQSQVIVVTHAAPLVDAIAARGGMCIELAKDDRGGTFVEGRHHLDEPAWKWS